MIPYREALAIVRERSEVKQVHRWKNAQDLPMFASQGQYLAAELQSPEAVPAFDNSAMDGYAVRALDTRSASLQTPVDLPILATIVAGDQPSSVHETGAVEIMTGAPLPLGPFDAVIRVEDTEKNADERRVLIKKPVLAGDNIRRRGSDFDLDQAVGSRGQQVGAEMMMACASLGIDSLPVQMPIRVALLTTGRELGRYNDKDLPSGMIRDASGPYLHASLNRPDFELIAHKMVIDEPDLFRAEVLQILDLQPDIIVSTGAVSMGKHDFIKDSLLELGAQLHFHKVAMRPGKPLLFAEWQNGPVWFGLPGNPISTLVGWRFFVDPYVRSLRGQKPETPWVARLNHPLMKPKDLQCFYKAVWQVKDGEVQVEVLEGQGSYMISPLLKANCWAFLTPESDSLAAGSLVSLYPLQTFQS